MIGREIEDLLHCIDGEIQDAMGYVRRALECRDSDKETADLYYRLSGEELDHASRLHSQVVRLMDAAQRNGEEIPAGLPELYRYLHRQHVDFTAEVVAIQAMYRGK